MSKIKDMAGKRAGRLTVVHPTEERYRRSVIWLCSCDCGELIRVPQNRLRNGCTRSCGCLKVEQGERLAEMNRAGGKKKNTPHPRRVRDSG